MQTGQRVHDRREQLDGLDVRERLALHPLGKARAGGLLDGIPEGAVAADDAADLGKGFVVGMLGDALETGNGDIEVIGVAVGTALVVGQEHAAGIHAAPVQGEHAIQEHGLRLAHGAVARLLTADSQDLCDLVGVPDAVTFMKVVRYGHQRTPPFLRMDLTGSSPECAEIASFSAFSCRGRSPACSTNMISCASSVSR